MNRSALRLSGYVGAALAVSAVLLLLTTWVSSVANAALDGPSDTLAGVGTAAPDGTADLGSLGATVAITANCRFGVYAQSQPDSTYLNWIAGQPSIGIGWNVDFHLDPSLGAKIPGAEYVPMIRTVEDRDPNTGAYLGTYHIYPGLDDQGVGALIGSQKGALWLVGNEPDRGPINFPYADRVQDDTHPDVYAHAYHDAYAYIKSKDPTAQVAIAGLVEVTPGRLNYLDQVWAAYQSAYGTSMPVDVWNMHSYYLPEAFTNGQPVDLASIAISTTPSLAKWFSNGVAANCSDSRYICFAQHDDQTSFQGEVMAMRTWMASHGQRQKPLIITEMGQLYHCDGCTDPVTGAGCNNNSPWDENHNCFTWTRTANFVTNSFNYLNTATDGSLGYTLDGNRLVQQWLWFAVQPAGFPSATMVTGTSPITYNIIGNAFKSFAQSAPQTINLIANSNGLHSIQVNGNGTMSITLQVGVYNSGSIMPAAPTAVTLYSDAGRTVPIATGFLTGARGCSRKETLAYVTWSVPANTTNINFFGRVDPGNLAGETTMADNDFAGSLTLNASRTLLPVILR
jgi:hypothetical protein